jgi:hypothetical protein
LAPLSRRKMLNNRKASRKTQKAFTKCSFSRFTPFYLQSVEPTSTILDLTLKELSIISWKPFLGTKSTWRYRWSPDTSAVCFLCQLHLHFFFKLWMRLEGDFGVESRHRRWTGLDSFDGEQQIYQNWSDFELLYPRSCLHSKFFQCL